MEKIDTIQMVQLQLALSSLLNMPTHSVRKENSLQLNGERR